MKIIKSKYDGVSYELHPGSENIFPVLYARYNNIKNGSVLSFFMQTDGIDFYREIKETLDSINNNLEFDECSFNTCHVEFNKEYIKVINFLDVDMDECVVKTDLFNLWLDEYYDKSKEHVVLDKNNLILNDLNDIFKKLEKQYKVEWIDNSKTAFYLYIINNKKNYRICVDKNYIDISKEKKFLIFGYWTQITHEHFDNDDFSFLELYKTIMSYIKKYNN